MPSGEHGMIEEEETGDSGWSRENLHKLVAAMKTNIPKRERRLKYNRSLKNLDWNKVAFPPFSPKACRQKWSEILHKMRKIRSLTELLDEADDIISKPVKGCVLKLHPQAPKKPRPLSSVYFKENHENLRKQHPNLKPTMLFKLALKQYKSLPEQEKASYRDKFNRATKEYQSKMDQFRRHYVVELTSDEQTNDEEDLPLQPPLVTGENEESARCWRNLSETERRQDTEPCQERFHIKEEQASDTEDEDLEDSSSEDEPNYVNFNKEEDEDDDDDEDNTAQ